MIWLYRVFVAPTATLALLALGPFHRKIGKGLGLRMRSPKIPTFSQKPIWIHAASGEFEYAKALIRELKVAAPEIPVVVTFFSPTYADQVNKFPGVDLALPLPLDLPGPISSMLRRLKPRVLLIARTDLWPELLTQVRARRIPIHVFSYTQKPPQELGWVARGMRRWLLNLVDQIHAVTKDDEIHLRSLGVRSPVRIGGDTRYDQVKFRLQSPKPVAEVLKPTGFTLVAGSTWEEDEKVILEALTEPLREGRMKLILVPHEPAPEHLSSLSNQLEKRHLSYALFSDERSWSDRDVLLVDRVGVLAELYRWGDVAFVGNSYRKAVHSVMEPLGTGSPIVVGPKIKNNREAQEFLQISAGEKKAVTIAPNADGFRAEVLHWIEKPDHLATARSDIQAAFNARLGANKSLIGELKAAGLLRGDG